MMLVSLSFFEMTFTVSFPFPIILALCLNYIPSTRFKKAVQNVTYAPHFISTVVMVSMLNIFFAQMMLSQPHICHMPLHTYRWRKAPASPMNRSLSRPSASRTLFTSPVLCT